MQKKTYTSLISVVVMSSVMCMEPTMKIYAPIPIRACACSEERPKLIVVPGENSQIFLDYQVLNYNDCENKYLSVQSKRKALNTLYMHCLEHWLQYDEKLNPEDAVLSKESGVSELSTILKQDLHFYLNGTIINALNREITILANGDDEERERIKIEYKKIRFSSYVPQSECCCLYPELMSLKESEEKVQSKMVQVIMKSEKDIQLDTDELSDNSPNPFDEND